MSDTIITDVFLFDGEDAIGTTDVCISGERILSVGEAGAHGPDVEVIDGRNRTLLPGLIDCHVHALEGDQAQAIRFGVTTLLDMFCDPWRVAEYKSAASTDHNLADLRSAGIGATPPGGHPNQFKGLWDPFPTIDDPKDARSFVQARIAEGSDYLKLFFEDGAFIGADFPTLDLPTATALVDAAHEAGLIVVAHAESLRATMTAVDAGVDGMAHIHIDEVPSDEFVKTLVERNVFIIATLPLAGFLCGEDLGEEFRADAKSMRHLNKSSVDVLDQLPVLPLTDVEGGRGMGTVYATIRKYHRAGVPLLAGTDSGPAWPTGSAIHLELRRFLRAGLTHAETLATATSLPAKTFGLRDRGRIQPGLRADLLLVDGDPLEDIDSVAAVAGVWRGGRPVDRTLTPA